MCNEAGGALWTASSTAPVHGVNKRGRGDLGKQGLTSMGGWSRARLARARRGSLMHGEVDGRSLRHNNNNTGIDGEQQQTVCS